MTKKPTTKPRKEKPSSKPDEFCMGIEMDGTITPVEKEIIRDFIRDLYTNKKILYSVIEYDGM